jgi:predicted amidohydrolase
MKISMVQVASPDEESAADRLARVAALVAAIPDTPDLIVLPELWRTGFNHFDEYVATAEDLDGETVATFSQIAAERGCYLHAGSIVRTDGDVLRNSGVLLDPHGELVHSFDKVHIFGYRSRETELLAPGTHVAAVSTPFGRISGTTCYDLRFPGLWTRLVDSGAEIVIVPAAWPAARLAHWRLLTTARAVDNQVIVVACNAVGTHGGVELAGHSRIVDPWGEVLVEAGTDEGVTTLDLDPGVVARTRTEFPVLADRLDDYRSLA